MIKIKKLFFNPIFLILLGIITVWIYTWVNNTVHPVPIDIAVNITPDEKTGNPNQYLLEIRKGPDKEVYIYNKGKPFKYLYGRLLTKDLKGSCPLFIDIESKGKFEKMVYVVDTNDRLYLKTSFCKEDITYLVLVDDSEIHYYYYYHYDDKKSLSLDSDIPVSMSGSPAPVPM